MVRDIDSIKVTIFWLYPVDGLARICDAEKIAVTMPANIAKGKKAIWVASLEPAKTAAALKRVRGLRKKYRVFMGDELTDTPPFYPYAVWEEAFYIGKGVCKK